MQKLQTDDTDAQQGTSTLTKRRIFTNMGRHDNDVSSVSQGPSCWDDVLLRNHVHGVCHSEGCNGTEAVSGCSYKSVTAKERNSRTKRPCLYLYRSST